MLDSTDGYNQQMKNLNHIWHSSQRGDILCTLGYIASGDAYSQQYDEVIKDILRKVKTVDDVLLFNHSWEDAFNHTFEYLSCCAKNGIILNRDKFQFCQDVVQFKDLQISPSGITNSESIQNAIINFPILKNITDARSWFGWVNQVA